MSLPKPPYASTARSNPAPPRRRLEAFAVAASMVWGAFPLGCGSGDDKPPPTGPTLTVTTANGQPADAIDDPGLSLDPTKPTPRSFNEEVQVRQDARRAEVLTNLTHGIELLEKGDPKSFFYTYYKNDGNLVQSDIDAFVEKARGPWGGRLLRGWQQAQESPPETWRWGSGFDSVTIIPGQSGTGGMHLNLIRGDDGVWRFTL